VTLLLTLAAAPLFDALVDGFSVDDTATWAHSGANVSVSGGVVTVNSTTNGDYEGYVTTRLRRIAGGTVFTPEDWDGADPQHVELFYSLYFVMTGLHALHMVIGIGILSVLVVMALRGRFGPSYFTPVELTGLYWHFVDIIWILLFPLLYLVERHS